MDGGTLNNVPADVVKAMGASVAIAVNVGSSTDEPAEPCSLFGVLGQTLDSMMTTRDPAGPEVGRPHHRAGPERALTGGDWRRTDDLVAQGYKAGEAKSGGNC